MVEWFLQYHQEIQMFVLLFGVQVAFWVKIISARHALLGCRNMSLFSDMH